MVLRGIMAAIGMALAGNAMALDYPQDPPREIAYALPDPARIDWQIVQRFAAFGTLPDAVAVFERYKFQPNETAQGWHERLWARDGDDFASPYAAVLREVAPLSRFDLTLDDWNRDMLPWDHAQQLHRPKVLEVLRNETNPDYMVDVTLAYPDARACTWDVGGGRLLSTDNCAVPVAWQVPITGATFTLRFDGALGATTFRVAPEHKVIVGMGDSYGSGEGNPDLPAKWRADYTPPADETTWLTHNDRLSLVHRARWLNERCHRSFFSAQSLTAFAQASQNPHQIVTFLHYACTGAEMFNGILLPQYAPGRVAKNREALNRFSQLNAAVIELCREGPLRYEDVDSSVVAGQSLDLFARRGLPVNSVLQLNDAFDVNTRSQRSTTGDTNPRGAMLRCPDGQLRAPDQILLSVGGNDIGFGNLIQYFLVPLGSLIDTAFLPEFCPAPAYRYDAVAFPGAAKHCARADRSLGYHSGNLVGLDQANGLRARYGFLTRAIATYLRTPPERILLPLYPDPLRTGEPLDARQPDTAFCGPSQNRGVTGAGADYDPLSPFNGLKGADPTALIGYWPFNLEADEAARALGQVEDMRIAMIRASEATGMTLACAGRDAFVGAGWWRGGKLNLPSHGSAAAQWRPAEWQPYAFSRSDRAVRTGNDSFLTQASGSNDIHGIMHPNLSGHTKLADVMLRRLAQ